MLGRTAALLAQVRAADLWNRSDVKAEERLAGAGGAGIESIWSAPLAADTQLFPKRSLADGDLAPAWRSPVAT